MKTFSEAEVMLAQNLPNFETRSQQQDFAREVEKIFGLCPRSDPDGDNDYPATPPRHAMLQAKTGVGKSAGYLIPAILSGKRTVVSVTTKALQEQLAGKDMPFLEQNLGVPFTWAMLKGISNYACLNRATLADDSEVPRLAEIIRQISAPGFGGTKEDLDFSVDWKTWAAICCDKDECDDNCTVESGCFIKAARQRALQANVVIVNHALFFTDLTIKSFGDSRSAGMLGKYDVAILDEGDTSPEVAANILGGQLSAGFFANMTSQARTWMSRYADPANNTEPVVNSTIATVNAANSLFELLQEGKLTSRHIVDLGDELTALYGSLSDLSGDFGGLSYRELIGTEQGLKAAKRKRSISANIREALLRMEMLFTDDTEVVRWVEIRKSKGNRQPVKMIKMSPVEVGPFFRSHLLDYTPTIFCSATLSSGGSFTFMADRLGLEKGTYDTLDVGSSFDFTTQTRLYVPASLPVPAGANASAWEIGANEEIVDLLKITKGRALVLFTSIRHMNSAFSSVQRRVPFSIRCQSDGNNSELVEWLKNSDDGVIFGTKSFFAGIDIQGAALSSLILCKLPFPVPTEPLFQARSEAIEKRGGSSFGKLSIPETSLVMQQAVGRLIRHRDDFGICSILDPRLVTKSYGKTLLKDLPPMPRVADIEELDCWFRGVEESKRVELSRC